jgi:hypothetical protein
MCCIPYVWIYLTCFVCLAACTILIAVTIEYNIDVNKAAGPTTATTPTAAPNASVLSQFAAFSQSSVNLVEVKRASLSLKRFRL